MSQTSKVTPEQIEEWKKKHGAVYEFSSEGKVCYLRKPSRDILRAANVGSGEDTIKWNEIIVKNCFLGGDEMFLTDDDYFFGLSKMLTELVETKKVELKKIS
jgi:hypothetical protein